MRFKVSEVHCSLHFSSQTDTSVRLDFMVFHFLWQGKYLSCDELAEKKNDVNLETFQAPFHSAEI